MKTLSEWLARGSAPKRAKKRIPKVTPKRAKANREYAVRRKRYLETHPWCEAWSVIVHNAPVSTIYISEEWTLPVSRPLSTQIHHKRKPRATYLNDESTWLAVSDWSHRWIEDHKKTARSLGLLE